MSATRCIFLAAGNLKSVAVPKSAIWISQSDVWVDLQLTMTTNARERSCWSLGSWQVPVAYVMKFSLRKASFFLADIFALEQSDAITIIV